MPQEKEIKLQELDSAESFDPLSLNPHAPFTQADFYGEWQKSAGRKVRRFILRQGSEAVAYLQMIKYPLPFGKSFFYIPYGPVIKDEADELALKALKKGLYRICQEEKAVFTRLDFTPPLFKKESAKNMRVIFRKAPLHAYYSGHFQPRNECFLDLEKSEEELLAGMHIRTRYNIKLAQRKGIEAKIVKQNFKDYFAFFYALMRETAVRNKFHLHPEEYYRHIFEDCEKNRNAFLVVAEYQSKILVVSLNIIFGKMVASVFSGSGNDCRNLRPNYLAQWEAVCQAKKLGASIYNFGGVSSGEKIYKNWQDLSEFKFRFGGRMFRHSDLFDLVCQPFWYFVYSLAKRFKNL